MAAGGAAGSGSVEKISPGVASSEKKDHSDSTSFDVTNVLDKSHNTSSF